MVYAMVLCFDKQSEDKFIDITKKIAHSGINKHTFDSKALPHITVAAFETDSIDEIIPIFDNYCINLNSENVFWASLGAFIPSVIYAAPVLNEYLLGVCSALNKHIEEFAKAEFTGHYRPYQWVPHTTLASRLNEQELKIAFDVAIQNFAAFGGNVNRLLLIECSQCIEVKTWHLT